MAGGPRHKTLAIWLVLLALGALIAYLEFAERGGKRTAADAQAARSRHLLPLPAEQIGALELAYAGALHRFERDASGVWLYHGAHAGSEGQHAHQADPAAAQRIADALAALGRAVAERSFDLDARDSYGVGSPDMLILAYRPGALQPLVQYAVGDIAPDGLSRYLHRVGGNTVITIPNYQIDNLVSLIKAMTASPAVTGLPPAPTAGGKP